ncbi:DUF4440 domain-containing protein [Sinomicrobium sp. FJxs]|uniref:DUF4440 domain-containing protein n=1 Tax=Sinomicrobium weinanense TaxID=2842200 RepID=A0A926JQN6_9FLAO|nr:DUF4440 domain-containing protein [Sinomicrobium weinanense]
MLFFQANAQTELEEAKQVISESNDVYFRAFKEHNASIFVDRYAEDCLIMAPNSSSFEGHDGALDFFGIAYDTIGLRGGKFTTTNIYGLGDGYVVEEGLWESLDKDHKVFDKGKFLVLWKKTAKGWKMFRDSFSSDGKLN